MSNNKCPIEPRYEVYINDMRVIYSCEELKGYLTRILHGNKKYSIEITDSIEYKKKVIINSICVCGRKYYEGDTSSGHRM